MKENLYGALADLRARYSMVNCARDLEVRMQCYEKSGFGKKGALVCSGPLLHLTLILFFSLLISTEDALAQSCSVGSASGNYGSVDILGGSAVPTSSSFTVTCTCGGLNIFGCNMNVCVQFGQGSPNANTSIRYMGSGTNTVQHELYTDSTHTQVWGSWGYGTTSYGTGGVNLNVNVSYLGTSNTSYTVYGNFKSSQTTAVPGTYTWSETGPYIAYSQYSIGSPNCGSNPGNYANGGSSPWIATINANCNISTNAINFGTLSLLTSNNDASGTVTVQCTNTSPYSIGIGNGSNSSGAQRRMQLGATGNYISYNLYTDSVRTQAWTTTTSNSSCTSGSGTCVLGTGTASNQNITVYGRIPPQSAPAPGTYTDSVIVTVTF